MDPVPDTWPPEGADDRPRVVPLFPLPHVWLFPGVILPLQVFEDRYKQMIEDILDAQGRFVIGTVVEGKEDDLQGSPPVYPIAGLGEIGRHERLDDGRFHILLVGLQRVRIREVKSDRLYRRVEIEPVNEVPVAAEVEEDLRKRLVDGILERTEGVSQAPKGSTSHLADVLALKIPLPHDVLNELYCELDTGKRAERVLEQHRVRPKTPLGDEPEEPTGDEGGEEGALEED